MLVYSGKFVWWASKKLMFCDCDCDYEFIVITNCTVMHNYK